MTPAQALVDWRYGVVEVDGRQWAYRAVGDGETVLLLDPPGLSGASGCPLEQLADRYRLIETTFVADDGTGAVEDPPARRAARLVRQLAETVGSDHFALISRGAATSVALWLAIEDPSTVTTLVLESPPPLHEAAALTDGPDAALVAAMPSLEVPTLVLLGEGVEPELREQLSTYKRLLPASTVGLVYAAGEDVRGDRPSAYLSAVTEYLERGQAFVVSNTSTVIHV